jgi:hypothetical protein
VGIAGGFSAYPVRRYHATLQGQEADVMSEATVTFQVDETLKNEFATAAKEVEAEAAAWRAETRRKMAGSTS